MKTGGSQALFGFSSSWFNVAIWSGCVFWPEEQPWENHKRRWRMYAYVALMKNILIRILSHVHVGQAKHDTWRRHGVSTQIGASTQEQVSMMGIVAKYLAGRSKPLSHRGGSTGIPLRCRRCVVACSSQVMKGAVVKHQCTEFLDGFRVS